MGGEKTVVRDDDRKTDIGRFADFDCADGHVVDFLRVFGHQDYPADIHRGNKVGMVAANIERAGDRPVDQIKNHRVSGARLHRHLLQRKEKPVGTGGIKNTATGCGRAIADTCRAMFTIARNEAYVMFTVGRHLVKIFGDFG